MKQLIFLKLILILLPTLLFAEESPRFPKEEAGISAYGKISEVNESNNIETLNTALGFIESIDGGRVLENKDSHIIGQVPVKNSVKHDGEEHPVVLLRPRIYIDIDGWMVAYFEKNEETSRMFQWGDYAQNIFSPNILKEALKKILEELEMSIEEVNYYHFQYPEASRISVVIDKLPSLTSPRSEEKNNFSVTVPENIKEASYTVFYKKRIGGSCLYTVKAGENFELDESGRCQGEPFKYGFYPQETFKKKSPQSVVIEGIGAAPLGMGTVLIY